jgi:hypothetical protein
VAPTTTTTVAPTTTTTVAPTTTTTVAPPPSVDSLFLKLLFGVRGVGPGKSLTSKVTSAKADFDRGNIVASCNVLGAFTHEVQAQAGKSIPAVQAQGLLTDANGIRSLMGCATGASGVHTASVHQHLSGLQIMYVVVETLLAGTH